MHLRISGALNDEVAFKKKMKRKTLEALRKNRFVILRVQTTISSDTSSFFIQSDSSYRLDFEKSP
jgi:hypothetical protein